MKFSFRSLIQAFRPAMRTKSSNEPSNSARGATATLRTLSELSATKTGNEGQCANAWQLWLSAPLQPTPGIRDDRSSAVQLLQANQGEHVRTQIDELIDIRKSKLNQNTIARNILLAGRDDRTGTTLSHLSPAVVSSYIHLLQLDHKLKRQVRTLERWAKNAM
jgi:hypothetical protein